MSLGLEGRRQALIEDNLGFSYMFRALTGTASGTNTYAVTLNQANIEGYWDGMEVIIIFANANTGASTLNINGLGAVALKDKSGNDFAGGEIEVGTAVKFYYTAGELRRTDFPEPSGADLYIDPDNGNDANDGTGSMSNAVETWDRINDLVEAGDVIEVKRGTVFEVTSYPQDLPFSGGLTNSGYNDYLPIAIGNGNESKWNNVTIRGETGETGKFTLEGRILFPNASITKTGGRTNVYQYTFPKVQNSTYDYGGLWEDDVYLFEVLVNRAGAGSQTPNEASLGDALTLIDSNAGYFHADFTTSSDNVTYYFHATASENPISNGKDYRARHTDFAFARHESIAPTERGNIFHLRDCLMKGFAHHNGPIYGGNIDVTDCEVIQPVRHGVMIHGVADNVKVDFPYLNAWGGYAFHGFPLYVGEEALPITWRNCNADYGENTYPATCAYGSHTQVGSSNSTITIEDSISTGAPRVYNFTEPITQIIIQDNSHTGARGFFTSSDAGPNRTDNAIHNETYISDYTTPADAIVFGDGGALFTLCRFSSSQYKTFLISSNTGGTIELRDMIFDFRDSTNAWGIFRTIACTSGCTIRLTRCVFINSDTGPTPPLLQVASGSQPTIDIQDCYFYDITVLGETTVAGANGIDSGFALSNVMEFSGSVSNPFTGDTQNNEWGLSGNADGVINSGLYS